MGFSEKKHFAFALRSERGVGLVEVMISAMIMIIIALAVGTYVGNYYERSVYLENAANTQNYASQVSQVFKSHDNNIQVHSWQPTSRLGRSPSSSDMDEPMLSSLSLISPSDSPIPGKFPLVDLSVPSTRPGDNTNAWTLLDNGANWALIRYNGVLDDKIYCSDPGAEIDEDDPIYPKDPTSDRPLKINASQKVFVQIQRIDPTGLVDCAGAATSGTKGTLKIIPISPLNRNLLGVGDPATQPGNGLKITITVRYNENGTGPEKNLVSSTILRPDLDTQPPEFLDLSMAENREIFNRRPSTSQPVPATCTTATNCIASPDNKFWVTIANARAVPGISSDVPVFCSDPLSVFSMIVAVNEAAVAFLCSLEFDANSSAFPKPPPPNSYRPCEQFAINMGPLAVTGGQTGYGSGVSGKGGVQISMQATGNFPDGFYRLSVLAVDAGQLPTGYDVVANVNTDGVPNSITFGVDTQRPTLQTPFTKDPNDQFINPFSQFNQPSWNRYYPFQPALSTITAANAFNITRPLLPGEFQCKNTGAPDNNKGWIARSAPGAQVAQEYIRYRLSTSATFTNWEPVSATGPKFPIPDSLPEGQATLFAEISDACTATNPADLENTLSLTDSKSQSWYVDFAAPVAALTVSGPNILSTSRPSLPINLLSSSAAPGVPAPYIVETARSVFTAHSEGSSTTIAVDQTGCYGRAVVAAVDGCGRTDFADVDYWREGVTNDPCSRLSCENGLICAVDGPSPGRCIPRTPCFLDRQCPGGKCYGCGGGLTEGQCYGPSRRPNRIGPDNPMCTGTNDLEPGNIPPIPFVAPQAGYTPNCVRSGPGGWCQGDGDCRPGARCNGSTCEQECVPVNGNCTRDSDCCGGVRCGGPPNNRTCGGISSRPDCSTATPTDKCTVGHECYERCDPSLPCYDSITCGETGSSSCGTIGQVTCATTFMGSVVDSCSFSINSPDLAGCIDSGTAAIFDRQPDYCANNPGALWSSTFACTLCHASGATETFYGPISNGDDCDNAAGNMIDFSCTTHAGSSGTFKAPSSDFSSIRDYCCAVVFSDLGEACSGQPKNTPVGPFFCTVTGGPGVNISFNRCP